MLALQMVLDTNVYISAALQPRGLQRSVLLIALTKPARLYLSEAILAELTVVMARPELKFRKRLHRPFLDLIGPRAHFVTPRCR